MSYLHSVSAHPLILGNAGVTGFQSDIAVTGATGSVGATGPTGASGPTGATGASISNIIYETSGPNAYVIVVEYDNGVTLEAGTFRGNTGETKYWLDGKNIGAATGGDLFSTSNSGELKLKGITGGGGVEVIDTGEEILIKFKTQNGMTASGQTGQLAFFNVSSEGVTGLSGATLTTFHFNTTNSLDFTSYRNTETVARLRATEVDDVTHTMLYKLNPYELFTLEGARNNTAAGTSIIVNPTQDTTTLGQPVFAGNSYFYRFIDTTTPLDREFSYYFQNNTLAHFSIIFEASYTFDDPRTNSDGDQIQYSHLMFPENFILPRGGNPIKGIVKHITFYSFGEKDPRTDKTAWYGVINNSVGNPFV